MRVLITGFGPFPGAPFNPSAILAKALARTRRPAFRGIVRKTHVFATSYAAVDRDLPELLAQKPDVVLMFGVAGRERRPRIETRARNVVSVLFPDAAGYRPPHRRIAPGGPEARHGGTRFARLLAAWRGRRIPCRLSRDAGDYLCNYAYWRALEASRDGRPPVVFVHIPRLPLKPHPRQRERQHSVVSIGALGADAESLLVALLAASRH